MLTYKHILNVKGHAWPVGRGAASHICTEQFINLEIKVLSDLMCWGVLSAVFVGLACDATTIPQCTPVMQPTMPSEMRKLSHLYYANLISVSSHHPRLLLSPQHTHPHHLTYASPSTSERTHHTTPPGVYLSQHNIVYSHNHHPDSGTTTHQKEYAWYYTIPSIHTNPPLSLYTTVRKREHTQYHPWLGAHNRILDREPLTPPHVENLILSLPLGLTTQHPLPSIPTNQQCHVVAAVEGLNSVRALTLIVELPQAGPAVHVW